MIDCSHYRSIPLSRAAGSHYDPLCATSFEVDITHQRVIPSPENDARNGLCHQLLLLLNPGERRSASRIVLGFVVNSVAVPNCNRFSCPENEVRASVGAPAGGSSVDLLAC
jgi:hypothetical protein